MEKPTGWTRRARHEVLMRHQEEEDTIKIFYGSRCVDNCLANSPSDDVFSLRNHGEYEFPFRFNLPESLPSTFHVKDRELAEMGRMTSSITYRVHAVMHRWSSQSVPRRCSGVCCSTAATKSSNAAPRATSSEKTRSFRVFSRGTCTLSASIDHDERPGDGLYEHSSKDMSMEVRLVEELAVDVPFRTQKRGATVLCQRHFPGVRAKRQADRALTLNLVSSPPWGFEPINPTMMCNFIKWKYRLIVSCNFRLS
ncbi:hypothetical protein V7S43_017570 [Phytophthora oleae]|uniref:Arrestin-like N-terminal domain-containing protein n=1 Tax=Phytophthora oleae TaxID=2107226 RepID=A0ABD3ET54_9STRA